MEMFTPDQAQDQLDRARNTRLATARDRQVHAVATAAFGVIVGVYVAIGRAVDGTGWAESLLLSGYALLLMVLAFWQTRAARTVPRHARRTGHIGLAGTVVLMLAAITWLNVRQSGDPGRPEHWWVLVLTALVVALPMLIAGHRIFHGDRR
jgi:cytochrome bd-type quinol oxidase subunit 2